MRGWSLNLKIGMLVVAGVVAAVLLSQVGKMNSGSNNNILKVAFPTERAVSDYEPTRIHVDNEYIFLETIYSPLVDLSDDKGAPIASVAKEHFWKGDELHFVIRDDLETIDGKQITVEDVIVSLKRVLILAENTHGDFKSIVCPDVHLKNIEDDCPGISSEDNTLVLKPAAKRDFLVSMLASIDFAIIPKSSIDPKNLKVIDYRNTSGPYYVDEDRGKGNIILKKNPSHFLATDDIAEEIQLVPTYGLEKSTVIEKFSSGEVDFITTVEGLDIGDAKTLKNDSINIHETMDIKIKVAFVTEKGMSRLSSDQRLSFAKSLQSTFHGTFADGEIFKASNEYFLPFSDGGFSKDQEMKLAKVIEDAEPDGSGKGISLGIFHSGTTTVDNYIEASKKQMPDLKVESTKVLPAFGKPEGYEEPDYILVSTDSGSLENISLLSYSMSLGIFGYSRAEGKAWVEDYMDTEDRIERLKKLKQMHLETLSEGRLIPLISTSYVAIANRNWKPQLSELFANCPLWKIKKN